MFFCLETKEPKVQDWIFLLKTKILFSRKSTNLRGSTVFSSIEEYCRASDSVDFICLSLLYNRSKKSIFVFLTQKSPKSLLDAKKIYQRHSFLLFLFSHPLTEPYNFWSALSRIPFTSYTTALSLRLSLRSRLRNSLWATPRTTASY